MEISGLSGGPRPSVDPFGGIQRTVTPPDPARGTGGRDGAIWVAAQALEANFLALMLEDAGVGAVPSAFGGGPGEAHFASFLREAQAKGMVDAGGIGLAESLFDAMKVRSDV